MLKNLKRFLRNRLLDYLIGLSADTVFTTDPQGRAKLNGSYLSPEQLDSLDREAKYLKSTYLWKILTETLVTYGQKAIFQNSKTVEDILGGKMILYVVDVQTKIVDTITSAYEKKEKE